MQSVRRMLVVFLSVSLALPCAVRAQQPAVVDQAMLDRSIAAHVQRADTDRRAIRRLLDRQEVRHTAALAGIDVKRAEAAVGTLDGTELHEIAEQARALDDSLAGGASVTISTTVIIIALLVLILIIVAVD